MVYQKKRGALAPGNKAKRQPARPRKAKATLGNKVRGELYNIGRGIEAGGKIGETLSGASGFVPTPSAQGFSLASGALGVAGDFFGRQIRKLGDKNRFSYRYDPTVDEKDMNTGKALAADKLNNVASKGLNYYDKGTKKIAKATPLPKSFSGFTAPSVVGGGVAAYENKGALARAAGRAALEAA